MTCKVKWFPRIGSLLIMDNSWEGPYGWALHLAA